MHELDNIIDLFFENIKHLFFPENWLQFDLKFSKSEIFAMLFIEKKHEVTMTELSEYINVPMSTANGLAERLLKKDYIVRERSESDRRIVVLRPTEKGSHLITDLKDAVSGYLKIAFEDLSEEEMQFLIHIVLKIVRNLQQKINAEPVSDSNKIRKIEIQ